MHRDKISLILNNRRLSGGRRLIDLPGMTAEDWERVYFAYLAFITQVRLIAAEVEARQPSVQAGEIDPDWQVRCSA